MKRNNSKSLSLFKEAQTYLPGGVDSPVRAFRAVGDVPRFIVSGKGSKIIDADGNRYIDYVCSWGPLILGHATGRVVAAVKRAIACGTSFGAATELEIRLAKAINHAMPSMEMVRFVNSGTEATMSAIRLARAFTGRDYIVKFEGCYHGHSDCLLVSGGSGMATLGIPDSPGVLKQAARYTLVAPFNNPKYLERLFHKYGDRIAAVIVEPVAANMGVVNPAPGFLPTLRKITSSTGALLIFDEVISGFRLSFGGAQGIFGIKPDLTCLGKIIGGGLPVGAYGGRGDIMQMVAPSGKMYQAGTLSGNPLAMTAGLETLSILDDPGVYIQLERISAELQEGIARQACHAGLPLSIARAGSLLTVFFSESEVKDYSSAAGCDAALFASFFRGLLGRGIYWPPSQFEAAFVSLAHSQRDIQQTVRTVGQVLRSI